MWEYAGVIRDNTGMTAGLGQLDQLEEELQSIVSDAPAKEIARIIEISHGLKTAKIILQAALRREESRGAHYRSDFPNPHPKWAGSQSVVTSPSGSLKWSFEPH